jgi:exopolyphosphatase/pppGpp-phosphohydrolase
MSISGTVSAASVARARQILARLVSTARSLGCREPVLVGTNTLREARNAGEIVRLLEREVSLPISVLSTYDEARLGYLGSAAFCAPDEALVLFDIGGTSTEISWGRGIGMSGYVGFPLGTERTRLICGPRFYSPSGLRRGLVALSRAIEELDRAREKGAQVSRLPLAAEPSTIILCTGGTAVSSVFYLRFMRGERPLFEESYPLSLDDIVLLRRRLAAIGAAGRERRLPLDANRLRLLPAGLVLTEALLRHCRVRSCSATARDLRWGVAITGGIVGDAGTHR